MPLVETVDLYQRYNGLDILKNINLTIERGEVFALIGPTGAGKTTLLRLIDLLDGPASGKIFFDGADTARSTRVRLQMRRRMAFVLQKPVVFDMSVYDNIAYGLRWRRKRDGDIRQRVNRILEIVGISPYRDRNARTLSGGEAQRVALARAIAIEPELLLLDEPTANLDPNSALRVEELIGEIYSQYQTTIVLATHDLSQGRRLAHRIGVMVKGEIVQMGKADAIFNSPANREVAEFVGVENIFSGTISAKDGEIATIDLPGNVIEAVTDGVVGEEVYACIRPEDITLALSKTLSSARNTLTGRITRVQHDGSLVNVEMDCGFPLLSLVTKRSAEALGLEEGKTVYAVFKATSVHIIKKH